MERKEPPLRIPVRKDPRTIDKYHQYDLVVRELFEDLVIKSVKMDLVALVTTAEGELDPTKFTYYTDPRSPDTGLRYARLLRRYLASVGLVQGDEVFASEKVGNFISQLIETRAGSRTPQAMLYTLEFLA